MTPAVGLPAELAARIAGWQRAAGRPLLVGLSGAQGSGKSTVAAGIAAALAADGLPTSILGLDDVYLTRADRLALAERVHPLLATRGPPGTHDLELAHEVLDALLAGRSVAVPRFDKPADDRAPVADWPVVEAPAVVLFEGWCVGARPLTDWSAPINALEAEEDSDGRWRAHVAASLAGRYAALWERLDRLTLLQAPDWPTVCGWRAEQEERSNAGSMDAAALARFMMHYERLTRAMLAAPPAADLAIMLDAGRRQIVI